MNLYEYLEQLGQAHKRFQSVIADAREEHMNAMERIHAEFHGEPPKPDAAPVNKGVENDWRRL